ncbi:probable histone-lysine N-methyltransferase set-23 isoform X1 [Drosophila pseudoobscura]|uniref:Probable histone-lysine N-methyltransferase set-23 isoform X1 n=1 Tax=Drosophila pseudoobscura pseudoobscura TaxID=46245 RepID=A0A6I8VP55_DROPS|nr:probable histone-lysine N-methyltransferase set-23 isoform X1 [Drosophila pseudoobscura]
MAQSRMVVNDDYEHPDHLEYILESVLMPSDESLDFNLLRNDYNSVLLHKCQCDKGGCANNERCSHGGAYEYCPDGKELIQRQTNKTGNIPIVECNSFCECRIEFCTNRLVQYGPRANLEVFNSPTYKSKGVRTKVSIPCGAFICEYAGEILTISEAKRRIVTNKKLGSMNYVLILNEYTKTDDCYEDKRQVTIIDPSRRGNIGRYINHSCDPNCHITAVRIDCPIPKICVFAARSILAQEELCFHYGGEDRYVEDQASDSKACLCSADSCAGFMPNSKII